MNVRLLEHIVGTSSSSAEVTPDGVQDIAASAMWDRGYDGSEVVVAVLDTGCNNHPDLAGQIKGGKNFTTDYGGDSDNFSDNHFHGTHVAGTIAAVRGNGIGVVGVAPDVKLLVLKVLSSDGSGGVYNIIEAIDYAIAWRGPQGQRVRVISMSLGTIWAPQDFHDAIKRADAADIAIVCASGNIGDGNSETNEVNYPAYYPECIAVGAYDMWGGVAYFSNSNNQIDICAPGVNVLSTSNSGGYVYSSGTSMAAPHVAGALALIANKLDKAFGRHATSRELYEELINRNTILLDVASTLQGYGALRFVGAATMPVKKVRISDVDFEAALSWLKDHGMFNTPAYWRNNAVVGKTIRGDYMREALIKIYIVQGLGAQVEK
ncbi:S8 family peptidase [Paenibacillus wynnii]|uniref:S8 family peptidase n=1 Tax=Paenibacillus wynnii TaxID=268407 RepID=UPI0009FFCC97|nr:S8 family peptidase [Paenibacillus wynnii]